MKVIGSDTDNETYILHVSKGELANILGCYSQYDDKFKELIRLASHGESIQVSEIYKNYYKVRSIVESAPYATAVTKLKEMLEAIEPINELIKEVKETYETN